MQITQTSHSYRAGFSLIEVIVSLGVIGILASAVAPLALKKVDAAKITTAKSDLENLSSATHQFFSDVGLYPRKLSSTVNAHLIISLGPTDNAPQPGSLWSGNKGWIKNYFLYNTQEYDEWDSSTMIGWNGPYLNRDPEDPWGFGYIVYVDGFFSDNHSWVISAGPNGTLNTDIDSDQVQSDDIGMRLE